MSFQGIRKIREAKRGSPVIFEGETFGNGKPVRSTQFNFELKSSNNSSDIRTTRDSEKKADSPVRQVRKSIFGIAVTSKEKEKKSIMGNFL